MSHSLDAVFTKRRIIITCGTGGVGKTTLSAAMAVRAALSGKRTVVITIDPAKRLATSLGLEKLGDQPTDLTEALREACRRVAPEHANFTGKLEAIVPDTKHTFETFVRSIASSDANAERVLRNPIFQVFAKEFSGTNEYMALERLYSLATDEDYDCIVLDTPPSRNTLAFLDAPGLLARLFEEKLIRWLTIPANKIVAAGMKKAMGVLERLTGSGFMTNLVDFSSALFEMQAKFAGNLRKVMELLRSDQVGALMVTTANPEAAPEIQHFIETLKSRGMNFEGVAVNRMLSPLGEAKAGAASDEALTLIESLQARERAIIDQICSSELPVCVKLPELARDVHSVEDLLYVALALAA
ncbi:MAG: ArsA family ATPase [Bdellovibrionia bacterium]